MTATASEASKLPSRQSASGIDWNELDIVYRVSGIDLSVGEEPPDDAHAGDQVVVTGGLDGMH